MFRGLKTLAKLTLIGFLLGSGIWIVPKVFGVGSLPSVETTVTIDDKDTLLEDIKKLGELTLVSYNISIDVPIESVSRFIIPIQSTSVDYKAYVDVIAGVDFGSLSKENITVDDVNKKVYISGVTPKIISSTLDASKSDTLNYRESLLANFRESKIPGLIKEAQEHAVEQAVPIAKEQGIISASEAEAKSILREFFHDLGYEVETIDHDEPRPRQETNS